MTQIALTSAPTERPQARIQVGLRWVSAAVAVVGLGFLAGAALRFPGDQSALVWWLRPTAPLTAVVVGSALALAFLVDAIPRWREGRSLPLPALGLMAGIAAGLGLASTARCTNAEDWVLTPAWNTLTMFVGTSPELFGPGDRCEGGVPLAAQLGRFLALAAVFGAALGIALNLLSDRLGTLRDRFASYRTVVIGVDDASLPLLQTLGDRTDSTGPIIVLARPGQDGPVQRARALGLPVRVVPELERDGTSPEPLAALLARFLTRRGAATALFVWVMGPDPERAVRVAEAARDALTHADLSSLREATRIVVRIDDRRTAERLRSEWVVAEAARTNLPDASTSSPVLDPVCPTDVTAAELIGRAALTFQPTDDEDPAAADGYTLAICGDTPLAEALIAQCAARLWESDDLRLAWRAHVSACRNEPPCAGPEPPSSPGDLLIGGCMPAQVLLVSPSAERLREHMMRTTPLRQRAHLAPLIRSVPRAWHDLAAEHIGAPRDIAFVIADPLGPQERHLPARLLSLFGAGHRVRVWVQPPEAVDPNPTSLNAGEEAYAENLLLGGSLPEDSWTRAARHAHERYRRTNWVHPIKPTRLPWWSPDAGARISPTVQANNLEAFRHLLTSVSRLGYVWQRDIDAGSGQEFAAPGHEQELERLLEEEFQRWRRGQQRMGNSLDGCPERWPAADSQAAADNAHREFTRTTVAGNLEILASYGYVPVPRDALSVRSEAWARIG